MKGLLGLRVCIFFKEKEKRLKTPDDLEVTDCSARSPLSPIPQSLFSPFYVTSFSVLCCFVVWLTKKGESESLHFSRFYFFLSNKAIIAMPTAAIAAMMPIDIGMKY